jgi:hypothetical protein
MTCFFNGGTGVYKLRTKVQLSDELLDRVREKGMNISFISESELRAVYCVIGKNEMFRDLRQLLNGVTLFHLEEVRTFWG